MQVNIKRGMGDLAGAAASLTRPQLAVILLLILALCIGSFLAYSRSRPRRVEVSGAGEATASAPGARTITVHVAGAVLSPGLCRLWEGSRVADALEKAGGASADAQLDDLNLAGKLADGQKVMVPRKAQPEAQPAAGQVTAQPASTLVNLNTATPEQLDALPGVGPTMAAKIIEYRQKNGPFTTVDELDDVSGIGPSKLEALRDLVTI
jgi:competence protein ComEA